MEIKKLGENSTDVKWKRGNRWILMNEVKLNEIKCQKLMLRKIFRNLHSHSQSINS